MRGRRAIVGDRRRTALPTPRPEAGHGLLRRGRAEGLSDPGRAGGRVRAGRGASLLRLRLPIGWIGDRRETLAGKALVFPLLVQTLEALFLARGLDHGADDAGQQKGDPDPGGIGLVLRLGRQPVAGPRDGTEPRQDEATLDTLPWALR